MIQSNTFNQNWASAPGSTILSLLKEKNISTEQLASKIKVDLFTINNLIAGIISIDASWADQLAEHLGASSKFWLAREEQYRRNTERLNSIEENKWLKELPVKQMHKLGWLPSTSNTVQNLLEFFDVPDVWAWKNKYKLFTKATSFRSSHAYESNFLATCAWLRQGERETQSIICKDFNLQLFKNELPQIKKLIRLNKPKSFLPKLKKICSECGVALVIVKSPRGCTASGATTTTKEGKVMLLMSFRYLSDDQFWFTFFHEAAHIILHQNKRLLIEEKDHSNLDDECEKEANAFAADILIPKELNKDLENLALNKLDIVKFSFKNDISPGILIGQLQHRGLLTFEQLNGYKRRYDWKEVF